MILVSSKMDDIQEQRHACKFCKKSFPCGRSLGGHMRSHMIMMNSAETEEKLNNSYGLRENPKKTWRLADSRNNGGLLEQEGKLCKECGKGFQSWKALFGHMRCHSEREKICNNSLEDEEDDGSWASSNHKVVMDMDSQSDNEAAVAPRRKRRSRRARYNNKISTTSSSFSVVNDSSSVSEIEQEQEEVAMCLMMLSRDVGYWGGLNSVADSSDDNSSFVLETRSSCLDEKITKTGSLNLVSNGGETVKNLKMKKPREKKLEFGVSGSQFPRDDGLKNPKLDDEVSIAELGKDSDIRYRHTEAELGKDLIREARFDRAGSRSRKYNSSKRSRNLGCYSGCDVSDSELGKDSIKGAGFDQDHSRSKKYNNPRKRTRPNGFDPELEENSSKKSKFECGTCNKIFHSYQALGGHRASHKRIKGCFVTRIERSENSIETDIVTDPTADRKLIIKVCSDEQAIDYAQKKNKGHECPICFKVFASGQALGGHKRSHLIGGLESRGEQAIVIHKQIPEINDLLDLNLPAPIEDEANDHVGFKPWWAGSSHKHELPLLGLISN